LISQSRTRAVTISMLALGFGGRVQTPLISSLSCSRVITALLSTGSRVMQPLPRPSIPLFWRESLQLCTDLCAGYYQWIE